MSTDRMASLLDQDKDKIGYGTRSMRQNSCMHRNSNFGIDMSTDGR